MRKLIVSAFVSLDGVVQAPGGPDEDRDGGFQHGGWTVPLWDDQMLAFVTASTQRAGGLVLGRRTYDIFASAWPLLDDSDPVAAVLNHVPKYVASRSLRGADLTWENSSLLGDVAAEVRALKEQEGGELQVHGSGVLIQTLLAHDLIDEFRLLVFPVLLGSGKRLFADGTIPGGLKLTDATTSSTGAILTTYQRAGDLSYGALGPEVDPAAYADWRGRDA